jgi:hypothetical protein
MQTVWGLSEKFTEADLKKSLDDRVKAAALYKLQEGAKEAGKEIGKTVGMAVAKNLLFGTGTDGLKDEVKDMAKKAAKKALLDAAKAGVMAKIGGSAASLSEDKDLFAFRQKHFSIQRTSSYNLLWTFLVFISISRGNYRANN